MENHVTRFGSRAAKKLVTCRLCMDTHVYFLSIFIPNEGSKIPIWKAIQDLVHLEVVEGDGLPDTVCRHCVRKVTEFYEFKDMCVKSASELRSYTIDDSFKPAAAAEELPPGEPPVSGEGCTVQNDFVGAGLSQVWIASNDAADRLAVASLGDVTGAVIDKGRDARAGGRDVDYGEIQKPEGTAVFTESTLLESVDQVAVKEEEAESSNLVPHEETDGGYNFAEDDFGERTAPCVKRDPLDVGNMVDDCYPARDIPRPTGFFTVDFTGKSREMSLINPPTASYVGCSPPEKSTRDNPASLQEQRNSFGADRDESSSCENNSIRVNEVSYENRCEVAHFNVREKQRVVLDGERIGDSCGVKFSDKSTLSLNGQGHVSERSLPSYAIPMTGTQPANSLGKSVGEARKSKKNESIKGSGARKGLSLQYNKHGKPKPFKCDKCGMRFHYESHRRRHAIIHGTVKAFTCEKCGNSFFTRGALANHASRHDTVKPFKCQTCGKGFSFKSRLWTHEAVHRGIRPWGKRFCGRPDAAEESSTNESKPRVFTCNTCGEEFSVKSQLFRHVASGVHDSADQSNCNSTNQNNYNSTNQISYDSANKSNYDSINQISYDSANKSNYNTSNQSNYNSTNQSNCNSNSHSNYGSTNQSNYNSTNQSNYNSTNQSNYNSTNQSNYNSTIQSSYNSSNQSNYNSTNQGNYNSTNQGNYNSANQSIYNSTNQGNYNSANRSNPKSVECDLCDREYRYKYELIRHVAARHSTPPYKCKRCGEEFNIMGHLSKHASTHSAPKEYKCDSCGKEYNYKYRLGAHLANGCSHTCERCGKRFQNRRNLEPHLNRHEGIRPHKCHICGRAYSSLNNMRMHVATHRTTEKFECYACGKKFTLKGTLVRHLTIHDPVKRFRCDVCGKGYQQKRELMIHVNGHSVGEPFRCDICGVEYKRQRNLVLHNRKHHP